MTSTPTVAQAVIRRGRRPSARARGEVAEPARRAQLERAVTLTDGGLGESASDKGLTGAGGTDQGD